MSCKECKHYHFYLMVQGPYMYAGVVPCQACSRFSHYQDNFERANPYQIEMDIEDFVCSDKPAHERFNEDGRER
jgi:hypothetical protein